MVGKLSSKVDVLRKILEETDVKKKVDSLVRYLAAYKVIEGNYELFDKLARCRDVEDFIKTVYEGVRVKDRVLNKLYEGIESGKYKVAIEGRVTRELLDKLFSVTKSDLEEVFKLAKANPRLIGSIIASYALSYEGIYEVRK